MAKSFYITTAIDYPNGKPHIGHAYEKIVADFYARWNRLNQRETHFLTGTDENGQKLIKSASRAGEATQKYVDKQVLGFQELCHKLDISYDDFIRTTEERHHIVCQNIWNTLKEKDQIYFDEYSGQYCYECENFYTETQSVEGKCPHHMTELVEKKEQGYFFKLSQYQKWLIDYIEKHPSFISPKGACREILSRLRENELKDLAISRPNQDNWGIPVPGDHQFVMYTWFDAVINYYSALNEDQQAQFWPPQCHVIGKDITWFHTVIWPAILKGCDISLPQKVYIHGMVLAEDGQKMSKSLGNSVDPEEMIEKYPTESFRYYILKSISSFGDGRFSEKELKERHNTELSNELGNLVFRTIKFSLKRYQEEVLGGEDLTQELFFDSMAEKFSQYVEGYEHHRALDCLWASIRKTNQYINDVKPWSHKDDPEKLRNILYNCFYALSVFSFYLAPALPQKAAVICQYLGISLGQNPISRFGEIDFSLKNPDILFSKFE